mgnify:CR=1 FL=1
MQVISFMGYKPQVRAPQDYGRRQERSGRERAKAKAAKKKHRSSRRQVLEEKHVPTLEEAVERTLSSLRILGNQRFALPPFYEHFNRWLDNLSNVLSEFELNPTVKVDGQFINERSQILSNVRLQLEEVRRIEASQEKAVRNLSESRNLLERIEKEHASKVKEVEERKNREINRLSRNVESLRQELDKIAKIKIGIFRAVSKKEKAQKEAEATRKLNSAQEKLESAMRSFTKEQEQLQDEYERRKQQTLKQIQNQQKRIETQESDRSLEIRQAACESLANAMKILLQRKKQETDEK